MDQIIVEGVRCFRNRQTIPLRPLTLLVGENSSGKSTALALTRIAWEMCHGAAANFNEEPFLLGAYDQIASSRGGRAGRAPGFTIGTTLKFAPDFEVITLLNRFVRHEAQPKLAEWSLAAGPYRLQVNFAEAEEAPQVTITTPTGSETWRETSLNGLQKFAHWTAFYQRFAVKGSQTKENHTLTGQEIKYLEKLLNLFDAEITPGPYAFAPVRSHPKRTYDPIKDVAGPEGAHIPMILARLSSSDQKNWESLRKALASFGKTSGLFNDVEVRRLGKEESDPFQLKIKVSNSSFNLMDVGYGVSQVLPIVVDVVRGRKGSTFLLQQPEVHLHPRAQAELGSFLGALAKTDQKRFVIETHSDHLVDRVRLEVRNKRLSPDDVALLYFERLNGHVEIRHLELDEAGNIINAPASYRQFFLTEEMRLLGFEG